MKPEPGLKVTANVRLLSPLSKGGMGAVWLAEHLGLQTQVAVKFILGEPGTISEETTARFRREASAAAKIRSPHVVQMLDHGLTDDGTPYIVMELLEGQTLAQHLGRSGVMSPGRVQLLVKQVAQVLTAAHQHGIIHRDIKPQNLFLIESPYELFVKVLDFGVAKNLHPLDMEALTSSQALVGTPYYMCPELIMSAKNVSPQADLWSLAVVAYRALTAELPFSGDSLTAIYVACCAGEYQRPSEVVPSLPPALDAWFYRALERDPERRFDSASHFDESFTAAVNSDADLLSKAAAEALDGGSPGPVQGELAPTKAKRRSGVAGRVEQFATAATLPTPSEPTDTMAPLPAEDVGSLETTGDQPISDDLDVPVSSAEKRAAEALTSEHTPLSSESTLKSSSDPFDGGARGRLPRSLLAAGLLVAVVALGSWLLRGAVSTEAGPAQSAPSSIVDRSAGSVSPDPGPTNSAVQVATVNATASELTATGAPTGAESATSSPVGLSRSATPVKKPRPVASLPPPATSQSAPAPVPSATVNKAKPQYCYTPDGAFNIIKLDGGRVRKVLRPECM